MTLSDILTFSRTQAQTDSNGLTDANGIVFANEAQKDVKRMFVKAGVDSAGVQEAYVSSDDGLGNPTGRILYPPDMLFLKAIELDYSGTGGSNYRTAGQIDVSNLPGSPVASFSWYRLNADTRFPNFDDHGDWFEAFPTPTSVIPGFARIFYFLQATNFSTTADTVSYPYSLDEALLGFRVAANYCRSLKDFAAATDFDNQYLTKAKEYIQFLSRGVQQPTQASPLQISGWEF